MREVGSDRGIIRFAPVALLGAVVVACTTMILTPKARTDLLPKLAGCYYGAGAYKHTVIKIDTRGALSSGGQYMSALVTNSKTGPIIVPDRRVFVDRKRSTRVYMDEAAPMILRSNGDGLGFMLPDRDGDITFQRRACSSAL